MKMKSSVGPGPCLTDTLGFRGALTENIKKGEEAPSLSRYCICVVSVAYRGEGGLSRVIVENHSLSSRP